MNCTRHLVSLFLISVFIHLVATVMLLKTHFDCSATLREGGGLLSARKREREMKEEENPALKKITKWGVGWGGRRRNQTTGVFMSPTSSPRLVWCFWVSSPRQYSPSSSLILLTYRQRGIWSTRHCCSEAAWSAGRHGALWQVMPVLDGVR